MFGIGYWMFWDIGSLTNQGGQHHTRMQMIDFVYELDPWIKNPISAFAIRRYIALKHGKTRCFITQGFQATATKSTSHWQQILPTMWGPNVMWTLVSNHPMNTRALFAYHQHNNNEFLQFCKPQPLASVFTYRTVMARNASYGCYLIAKLSWGYHSIYGYFTDLKLIPNMDLWLTYNWNITDIFNGPLVAPQCRLASSLKIRSKKNDTSAPLQRWTTRRRSDVNGDSWPWAG